MILMSTAASDHDKGQKLSTLWLVVALNIILADVLSLYVELVNHNTLNIPGDVTTFMVIGALLVNIPIMMVYVSKHMRFRASRIVNIAAAVVTALFIVGGGSATPHYLVIACIELLVLGKIILEARQWQLSR
jgi:hypothetical protein